MTGKWDETTKRLKGPARRTMWEVEFHYQRPGGSPAGALSQAPTGPPEDRLWAVRRYTGRRRAITRARMWAETGRIPGENPAGLLKGRTALVFERRHIETIAGQIDVAVKDGAL